MGETRKLDWTKPQGVDYCLPLPIRDRQIEYSISRIKGRLQPTGIRQTEPIAIVCFGPSLADTWEEIRRFKYVMTCSGAHKFLVDRGIVPTHHIDVDPRPHKVTLMGPPHKDVEYLIASTCCKAMWDHLEGFNVKLWHIFDTAEEGLRILPRGEMALTGGCGAGLRAMIVARVLGFTDQHVFGMDGCAREGASHAAEHCNAPPRFNECEYGGKIYHTTSAYLEVARQTPREIDLIPDCKATFYGDGLVQAMMRDHKPAPQVAPIAYDKPETISAAYRELNARMHEDSVVYGVGGARHAKVVESLLAKTKVKSVLDYGCGKGMLAKSLAFPIWEYDPAIPGKDAEPRPADLVVCTDVLEHIEPDKLGTVLNDLQRLTQQIGYFVIHTGPAKKTLPDGRNTHLIQRPLNWWHAKLSKRFTIGQVFERGPEVHFVVQALPLKKKVPVRAVVA